MNPQKNPILETKGDPAIQAHINMLQGSYDRMTQNCANCKTWTVTIVTAVLLFYLQNTTKTSINLAYIPIFLFYFLDCYYVGRGRETWRSQRDLVTRINNGEDVSRLIYLRGKEEPTVWWKKLLNKFLKQILFSLYGTLSLTTTVFYGALFLLIRFFVVSK